MQPLGSNPGSCIGINYSSNRGYIARAHLAWGLEHHCASDCWHLDRELTEEKMDWSDWVSRVMTKWLCRVKGDLGKKTLLIIFRFLSLRLFLWWWKGGGESNNEHTFREIVLHFSQCTGEELLWKKIKFSKCKMWPNCRPWFGALEISKRRRSPACYFSRWVEAE